VEIVGTILATWTVTETLDEVYSYLKGRLTSPDLEEVLAASKPPIQRTIGAGREPTVLRIGANRPFMVTAAGTTPLFRHTTFVYVGSPRDMFVVGDAQGLTLEDVSFVEDGTPEADRVLAMAAAAELRQSVLSSDRGRKKLGRGPSAKRRSE
jgi:hypothetical protein